MKRIIFILLATMMSTALCSAAMSNSKVRKETLFLTDKMAYELKLNTEQYNDVYEINYDFISGIRYLMDDVLRGEEWALNRYYDYLDVRNDDLRWVLSDRQFSRFMQAAYFYRPVYVSGGRWSFRVYITYSNRNHFYFPRPYHYRSYSGGHYRTHHNNKSYYRGRYRHPHYNGAYRIRNHKSYNVHLRSDFGSVKIRPNSNRRPAGRDDVRNTRRNSNNNRKSTPNNSSIRNNNNSRNNGSSIRNNNNNSRNNGSSIRNENKSSSRRESVNSSPNRTNNAGSSSTRRSNVNTNNRNSSKEKVKVENTRTKNNDKSSSRTRVKTENKEKKSNSRVRSSESRRSSSTSTTKRNSGGNSTRSSEGSSRR